MALLLALGAWAEEMPSPAVPTLTLVGDALVQKDNNFTVTVGGLADGERCELVVLDGWQNERLKLDDVPNGTFEFPASDFYDGEAVFMTVVAQNGNGDYDPSTGVVRVFIIDEGARDDSIALFVNGSSTSADVLYGDMMTLAIEADKALEVQFNVNGWWDTIWQWNAGTTRVSAANANADRIGTSLAVARARYETANGSEWRYSNFVTLNVETNGRLDAPKVEAPATVKQGEDLVVLLHPVANAERYNLYIDYWDDEGSRGVFSSYNCEPGTLILPTSAFPNGSYSVSAIALAKGYESVHGFDGEDTRADFTVTDAKADVDVAMMVNKTEVLTGEDLNLYVYAPDATSIYIYREDGNWIGEGVGPHLNCNWNGWGNSTETLHAVAYYDDGSQKSSDAITVHWTAPYGQLERPTVTLSNELPMDGEEIVITVSGNPDAQFNYSIFDRSTENAVADGDSLSLSDGAVQITLPALLFDKGHSYDVYVSCRAKGYQEVNVNTGFVVMSANTPDATLTADGSTDDISVLVHERSLRFVGEAPQAATGIALVENGGIRNYEIGNRLEVWNDFSQGGLHKLSVLYTTKPIDESTEWWRNAEWVGSSNTISVSVTSYGELPKPQVTIPDTVKRGDTLIVTVDNAAEFEQYDGVTVEMSLYATYEEAGEELWYDIFAKMVDGQMCYPTGQLRGDIVYRVTVSAFAAGYEGSWLDAQVRVSASDMTSGIYTDKFEMLTREYNRLIGYADGAKGLRLFEHDDLYIEDYDRTYIVLDLDGFSSEYTAVFTLKACYSDDFDDEDAWQLVAGPVSVAIKAPYGSLPEPTITMDDVLVAPDSTFDVAVDMHGTQEWTFHVMDKNYDTVLLERMSDTDVKTFAISTAGMQYGDTLIITASANAVGYNSCYSERSVVVSAPRQDPYTGGVLRLPETTVIVEDEAFYGVDAQTVVINENCELICFFAFANCPNLQYVVVPGSATEIDDYAFFGSPVILICPEGSAADQFAQRNGIKTMRP